MKKYMLEVCTGSYLDCLEAYKGGAKRVELNSALYLGGLTPSLGTLKKVKEKTDLIVICMVRPRGAGFCYEDEEFEVMKEDAKLLLENGADGIAFGCLKEDGSLDIDKNAQMVEIIHSYQKTAVFHRAFDVCKNPYQTIEQLIALKVDRLLTSGQKKSALEGIALIKELIHVYGEQIEILPGSGINATNVKEFLPFCGQVHSSCKVYKNDKTTTTDTVSFSYNEDMYEAVDQKKVIEMIKIMEERI